jgi:hypothetical protein
VYGVFELLAAITNYFFCRHLVIMKNFKILFFLLLVLIFTSCKKSAIDRSILLINEDYWRFESLSGFSVSENQIRSQMLIGSRYRFLEDGTYWSSVARIVELGKWEFNDDKTVIILNSGESNEAEWTIITLSEDELTVSLEHVDALNGKYIMTFN